VVLAEVEMTPEEAGSQLDCKEGKYVKLCVNDTGHGMNEEMLDRVFEPFFTTKEAGEGTGLGLSVVHGIVKDHDGEIQVQSEIGKGTSFFVFLPVCGEEKTTFETPENVQVQSSPQESRRVFLVDDDRDFCEMARMGLELLGYTVESHSRPVEAVDSFCANPLEFDIVITDQVMPSITGLELVSRIRRIRSDVAIVLLSGLGEMLDDQQVENLGISERLVKPVTPRDLATAIQRVCS
jgi:CheY-like chemotaxis protein